MSTTTDIMDDNSNDNYSSSSGEEENKEDNSITKKEELLLRNDRTLTDILLITDKLEPLGLYSYLFTLLASERFLTA
ncbi:22801_t:CDS:2 [Entrophospora sp. SA101]|nr:22801_t:CDS:2 [Entrophospora sp. SA101]